MKLTDVIRRPLITEKSTLQRELGNVLAFEVHRDATKVEIRQAIDVRTASQRGKLKRQGKFVGRRNDWKKAYVRLQADQKVPEILEIA
jgi:large subunit ribosomal protein L23